MISYEIIAVEPWLCVNECVGGTGGLCGSTELNRRFESLVKSKIGERYMYRYKQGLMRVITHWNSSFDSMTSTARSIMMRHFDEFLKPTFCPPEEDDDDFDDDTYHCPVPGVQDSIKNGICRGHLTLTTDDMKGIFHPTFSEITRLVQDQATKAEKTVGKAIKVWPMKGNASPFLCILLIQFPNFRGYYWLGNMGHHNTFSNICVPQ